MAAAHQDLEARAEGGPAPAGRLALNFLLLAAGEVVAKILTFLSFSYLARTLGPERFGGLEFTLAVMVFFTLPVDLGLGAYGAREIAKKPSEAAALFREISGIRLVLACCCFAALSLFIAVLHKSTDMKLLLLLYGLSLFGGPALLQWFFQAHDRMHWVAAASIVRQLTFAALIFAAIGPATPLMYIGAIECVSMAAVAFFCLYVVRRRMGFPLRLPSLSRETLRAHLPQAWPIGITEVAWAFMWYFATVLLGFLFADESLGWFGASHRVLMAFHTFVWLYFFNLLPSISRCAAQPHETLLALMHRSMMFAAWTSIYVAFLLTVLARPLMTLAFGNEFAGSAASLRVLAWMLPVAMLSGHHRFILVAYGRQTRLLWCTAVSAGVTLVCGVALVPSLGAIGAAWALLAANVVNFGLAYREVRREIVRVPFLREALMPSLGLAISGALFLVSRNVWLAVGVATLGYGILFARLHGRDVAHMWRLVRRSNPLPEESAVA